MLTMMLLGVTGVSVEKCSCTGRVTLAIPVDDGCCSGEGDCMMVKSMQLSDYVPTAMVSLDVPVQPVLFTVIPPQVPVLATSVGKGLASHSLKAPPGELSTSVVVLRV